MTSGAILEEEWKLLCQPQKEARGPIKFKDDININHSPMY